MQEYGKRQDQPAKRLAEQVERIERARREAWEPVRCQAVTLRVPQWGGRRIG